MRDSDKTYVHNLLSAVKAMNKIKKQKTKRKKNKTVIFVVKSKHPTSITTIFVSVALTTKDSMY